ncbi:MULTISPECIES: MOSC domain-containing protein [unclassified Fusibacter]|uniref:MOSC domain-containing protein n=1 Tax=unclassified Fusibacter TaxID=2624464 RepID=UPI00101135FC|nr:MULTISPECIES: MOSC domain-containing protein [unclassified Fusibacter]MCK8061127.1 MOSC domain-containing protein [Fusibacter sp. A2]NPE23337.1 MOSC domain-containing protein [Fusibacter sp. A1]RXV59380.1 MOSC domain-containing protein [Fusibacter sp. A1]
MVGKVLAISISETKGVPKNSIPEAKFIADFGIEGDAHAGKWHRQVSLLANESVDKMREKGVQGLCTGKFAENITTEGLNLWTIPVGSKLYIGETVHEVSQIGKECHHGCAIKQQVGECVMPKEGIFTKVLVGGVVKVGDEIKVEILDGRVIL